MKFWIRIILCLPLLLSALPFSAAGLAVVNGNLNDATALFLISGENKAGQEFVLGFEKLTGITVSLENTEADNTLEFSLYQGSAAEDSATLLHTQSFTLAANGKAWYRLDFDKTLTLQPDVLYSFVLHTQKRAVWFGVLNTESSCKALNYDVAAYGGWIRNHLTAFEAIPLIEDSEPYLAVIDLIAALPETITLEQEAQVEEALAALNILTPSQRGKVTNLNKLTAAEATIQQLKEDEANAPYRELDEEIAALFPVTEDSRAAIVAAMEKRNALMYQNGTECVEKLKNAHLLTQAIQDYNAMEFPVNGDVNGDKAANATDALSVLQNTVQKREFDQQQARLADVNLDGEVNAADALMILQFAVKKIDRFPADVSTVGPIVEQTPMYSQKGEQLFANTYASMIDRTKENGYAQTSINGVYPGMFGRDSSIQIMAHVAAGDYDRALKIMDYFLEYHKTYGYDYVLHVMDNDSTPISTKLQVDSTFFFLHAWYLYATQAPESPQKTAFLQSSQEQVVRFANYFMDSYYLHENNLVLNPSLEHSREGRYWYAYDLLTNTYASQGWYEMSLYFADILPEKAKAWGQAAQRVADGIHQHLVSEIDGKKFYAELIDVENNDKFVCGFSWVNLAPMGCDWYAADPEILENTYQLYLQYGSCKYYDKYQMLDVAVDYTGEPLLVGNHIIGKGLAWEMLYCKKMGYTQRLTTLTAFVENHSEDMYRETWVYSGGGSDTANQEHAGWMLYAHKLCYPDLETSVK